MDTVKKRVEMQGGNVNIVHNSEEVALGLRLLRRELTEITVGFADEISELFRDERQRIDFELAKIRRVRLLRQTIEPK